MATWGSDARNIAVDYSCRYYEAADLELTVPNVLLFPAATQAKNRVDGFVGWKERLGGLLKYYHREAA